jgi:RNA recognition motif-containing protein
LLALCLRGGGKEEFEHKIFVANLPRTLDDKGLKEAFSEFGKIKSAKVLQPQPPRGPTDRDEGAGAPGTDTQRALLQVMLDIETGQSRRMGYVTFEEGRSVDEAVEEMHETAPPCPPRARQQARGLWAQRGGECAGAGRRSSVQRGRTGGLRSARSCSCPKRSRRSRRGKTGRRRGGVGWGRVRQRRQRRQRCRGPVRTAAAGRRIKGRAAADALIRRE